MAKLIREPLLHFFVLGALLFALYGLRNRDEMKSPDRVVVDQVRVDALANQFGQVWKRPPTVGELQGLVDTWVRDEILYREGMAAGMDKGDSMIRRRVAQKMADMSEGMAADVPTEAELQTWLEAHAGDYRIEPRYSLRQIYFDPQRHGQEMRDAIDRTLTAIRQGRKLDIRDATLLPSTLEDAPAREVGRVFGEAFVDALHGLPQGEWHGPIRSGYGLHIVRIDALMPGRAATLAEVRQAVERDIMKSRSDTMAKSFYDALRTRYTVVIDAKLSSVLATQRGAASD